MNISFGAHTLSLSNQKKYIERLIGCKKKNQIEIYVNEKTAIKLKYFLRCTLKYLKEIKIIY